MPGHTVGHIAYYFAEARALFSADSLMVMGCGRLFEGTPEQMWESLSRLAALPDDTLVYSGHEYAESNARFALSVDGENPALQARAKEIAAMRQMGGRDGAGAARPGARDQPVPAGRWTRSSRRGWGWRDLPDAQVFAEIRRRKDAF